MKRDSLLVSAMDGKVKDKTSFWYGRDDEDEVVYGFEQRNESEGGFWYGLHDED